MKKVLVIAVIAMTLVSCAGSHYTCAGVDGGRASRSCSR